jgi:hypothetical protein
MEAPATFRDEVAERFGVLPNFFCSAKAAPGLIERLWDFAKSAYLDNPLPSLVIWRIASRLAERSVPRSPAFNQCSIARSHMATHRRMKSVDF